MLKFPLLVIALISFTTPALAGNKCDIGGFVKEKADVYDKAKGGKIIGSIPGTYAGTGETPIPSMAEVQIIEGKDGWFKIMNATDNAALMEANEIPMRKCSKEQAGSTAKNWPSNRSVLQVSASPTVHRTCSSRR